MFRELLLTAAISMWLSGGLTPARADDVRHVGCAVEGVAVFPKRIHIRCTPNAEAARAFNYFAVPVKAQSEAFANRILMLATSALQGRKSVEVWFRAHPTIEAHGCQKHDCRELTALEVFP
jgi:hypothetical protein